MQSDSGPPPCEAMSYHVSSIALTIRLTLETCHLVPLSSTPSSAPLILMRITSITSTHPDTYAPRGNRHAFSHTHRAWIISCLIRLAGLSIRPLNFHFMHANHRFRENNSLLFCSHADEGGHSPLRQTVCSFTCLAMQVPNKQGTASVTSKTWRGIR